MNASTFYIGFTQRTDQPLDVGVDRNNNTVNKIFYNVLSGWSNPAGIDFEGSLMMHPVFGVADFSIGINQLAAANTTIIVNPNPANDKLYIKTDYPVSVSGMRDKETFSIIDLYGRTVLENKLNSSEYIDISNLSEGIYFIRIFEGTQVSTQKFIKAN